jgi:epoxyqueuosine reductase
MAYLHRHLEQRIDPARLLEGARSVIVVALLYHQTPPPPPAVADEPIGRVAMYAWGDDYHRVVRKKLHALADALRAQASESCETRVCVDTAPILEREIASRAGIGWTGKNTMVLSRGLGSYFFLGEVLTTLELAPDEPVTDHCGTCTRCLDACPTGAFPAPYEMDASRCVSYLTIEHREDVPDALRAGIGHWVFGCDVCQEVCPFNRDAPITAEPRFKARPPWPYAPLRRIARWSRDDYDDQLRGSAMKRAKPEMMRRNAAIALDNSGVHPISEGDSQKPPRG